MVFVKLSPRLASYYGGSSDQPFFVSPHAFEARSINASLIASSSCDCYCGLEPPPTLEIEFIARAAFESPPWRAAHFFARDSRRSSRNRFIAVSHVLSNARLLAFLISQKELPPDLEIQSLVNRIIPRPS